MTITPESVNQLLHSENFGDRIRGINELKNLEHQIAYELIQPILKDDNVRVRYAAVSQLDSLGEANRQQSLELLLDILYNDPEADVRAAAADTIAGLKLTEAFPDLKKVYEETSEWLIQFSIIAALGELGHPEGFEVLTQALTENNPLLQTTAISALGELGDTRAIDLLLPFVDNPDWQIRHRLAQALGKLGGETQEALQKLAEDDLDIVAQEAKNYLNN